MPKSQTNEAHLLEDLTKMYDSGYEIVVGEPLGNAVDINSTRVDITIASADDGNYIEFHNNGPPMKAQDFDIYHILAESTKTYGISLGWAGLGSKLYLGVKKDSKIITTSSDGIKTIQSVMFLKDQKQLWHEFTDSQEKFLGTKYKAILKDSDYEFLSKNAPSLIREMFNVALLSGVAVTVNGVSVEPWNPQIDREEKCILKIENREIPFTVWATKDEIPAERSNAEYHVTGKTIVSRTPKNLLPRIKKDLRRKFFITIDAMQFSDQLQTTKKSFRPGLFTSQVEPGIEKIVLEILKGWGFLEDNTNSKTNQKSFSKIIEEILKCEIPDLKMEGPSGSSKGSGKSKGKGTKTSSSTTQSKKQSQNQKKNQKNPRRKGGLSVSTTTKEDDPRQGWTQIETNEIVINMAHVAYKMVEKNTAGKEYHMLRVVCNELVKNYVRRKNMDVETALEYSDRLFNGFAKFRADNPRASPWKVRDKSSLSHDENGRFSSK